MSPDGGHPDTSSVMSTLSPTPCLICSRLSTSKGFRHQILKTECAIKECSMRSKDLLPRHSGRLYRLEKKHPQITQITQISNRTGRTIISRGWGHSPTLFVLLI